MPKSASDDATVSELAVWKSSLSFSRINIIEQHSNPDKVLHHHGPRRSCAFSDRRAANRELVFPDNFRAGDDPDSAARGRDHQGRVRAHYQGKFLREHRNQQQRDLGRIVGKGQTLRIGQGIVGPNSNGCLHRLLRHRRPAQPHLPPRRPLQRRHPRSRLTC